MLWATTENQNFLIIFAHFNLIPTTGNFWNYEKMSALPPYCSDSFGLFKTKLKLVERRVHIESVKDGVINWLWWLWKTDVVLLPKRNSSEGQIFSKPHGLPVGQIYRPTCRQTGRSTGRQAGRIPPLKRKSNRDPTETSLRLCFVKRSEANILELISLLIFIHIREVFHFITSSPWDTTHENCFYLHLIFIRESLKLELWNSLNKEQSSV